MNPAMQESLLRMERVGKSFSGTRVLDGVDFDLVEGEVHVLAGENGAGKSTLIKIISEIPAIIGWNLVILAMFLLLHVERHGGNPIAVSQ